MEDTSLFDEPDADTRPDPAERRAVRRQVLAWVLRTIRARRGWNVNDAASAAGIAPMTWRRLEDALDVRTRTLTALDTLLGQPFGTVRLALDDDATMVAVAGLAEGKVSSVQMDDAAGYLDELAERYRSGASHTVTVSGRATVNPPPPRAWPAVDDATRQALAAAALHVPAVRPTDLELVNRLVEQLTRSTVQTSAVRALIQAAAAAVPDLIAQQLAEAERALADSTDPLPAEHDEDDGTTP